jgi:phosphatidylserine decarboxylase
MQSFKISPQEVKFLDAYGSFFLFSCVFLIFSYRDFTRLPDVSVADRIATTSHRVHPSISEILAFDEWFFNTASSGKVLS